MIELLVDTSVLVKWFDVVGEDEVDESRALRDAHVDGSAIVGVLDLALYELSNVLLRRRRWSAADAGDQMEDLLILLGSVVRLDLAWLREALVLAERHGLSGYDAHWSAAARYLGVPLVSADRQLLDARLAESPTTAAARLGLAR